MPKDHLTNEEFFTKLASLFDANTQKEHGSVFLTQKRLTYGSGTTVFTGKKGQTDTLADLQVGGPLPVLVRATNGDSKDKVKSKIKISTVVQPDDLESFFSRYAEVCRAGMVSLKKRDRSLQKKKAKKRKVAAGASSAVQI